MNVAATLSLSYKEILMLKWCWSWCGSKYSWSSYYYALVNLKLLHVINQLKKANPKTSELAALSAIKKLKSLNKQFHVGT